MIPESKQVDALLKENRFSIPPFQRDFMWEKEQVDEFINTVFSESGQTFLGNMILQEVASDSPDPKLHQREVIDGQQRITMLFLVLALIRNEIERVATEQKVPPRFSVYIHEELIHTGGEKSPLEARFYGNDTIADSVEKYIIPRNKIQDWPQRAPSGSESTEGEKNLRKAWKNSQLRVTKALDQCKDLDEQHALLETWGRRIVNDFFVLTLTVQDRVDAYEIFISVNSKGKPLSATDLMKTELMKLESDQHRGSAQLKAKLNKIEEIWQEAKSLVKGSFDVFMRHALAGELQTTVTKREMLTRFLKGREIDKNTHISLLKPGPKEAALRINRLANFYGRTQDADTNDDISNYYLRLLNGFSDTYRIFATQLLESDRFTVAQQRKALRAAINLSARWGLLRDNAQELENVWVGSVKLIRDGDLGALEKHLKDELPPNTRLMRAFENEIAKDEAFARTVLTCLHDFGLMRDAGLHVSPSIQLEHIAPKNPGKETSSAWHDALGVKNKKEYEEFVPRWGNLTLLTGKENASLKDVIFLTKLNGRSDQEEEIGYKNSKIMLNQYFTENNIKKWTIDTISERETELGRLALKAFS